MSRDPRSIADLVVRNADLVATMDDGRREIPGGWIAITAGLITGIGTSSTDVPAAEQVIDAQGCLVTPGFVNTHHHIFQNLTRTALPALAAQDFFSWLRALFPLWLRLDEEAVYVSAWIGLAELACGGTTTTSDMMYMHHRPKMIDAEIRAAVELGMRFHPTRGAMNLSDQDGGLPPKAAVQDDDEILADAQRLVETYHDPSPAAMLRIAMGPCTAFTASGDLYTKMAVLAEKYDIGIHSHLAESPLETQFCMTRYGRHPIDQLKHVGLANERTWGAHVFHPRPEDIARLADWGVGVAHCPSALAMMGGRNGVITPIREMRDAGVKVGLGCDGSASSDGASLWLEARTMIGLARLRHPRRIAGMPAREALEIATRGGAAVLGRQGEIGELSIGAAGDLVAWPLDGIEYAGAVADPVSALFQSGPNKARHTVVAGRALVQDGQLTAPGVPEMLARHRSLARKIQGIEM